MMARCKICRCLIVPAALPVGAPLDAEQRKAVEFGLLAEAARAHVYAEHKQALAAYGGLVDLLVQYLASLFAEGVPDIEASRAALLAGLVASITEANVQVVLKPAAASPAAGGGVVI